MRGEGSGFIVSGDGIILTNAHVVDGAQKVTVKLTDRREFEARVIGDGREERRCGAEDRCARPAGHQARRSRTLQVGEWVVAIGSPFGLENSVTAGIVSAKGRSLPQENYVPFIQTDVAVNPGNSGGPLFNLRGEVVGINSQIYSRSGGYKGLSFAIPIDVAMNVGKQLKTQGQVTRGRLGVGIQEVTGAGRIVRSRRAARRARRQRGKGRAGRKTGDSRRRRDPRLQRAVDRFRRTIAVGRRSHRSGQGRGRAGVARPGEPRGQRQARPDDRG